MTHSSSSSRRWAAFNALAAAGLLVVSGCGSDAETGSASASGSESDAVAAASSEVRMDPAGVDFAPSLGIDLNTMARYDDGLYVQTTREGEGKGAAPGDTLALHFTLWLSDGTRVDSNENRPDPMEVIFGESTVIQAWNRGLYGIKPGERRRLVVPPDLGHGRAGLGDAIPPDAVLIFDLSRVDGTDSAEGPGE